jgi:hypothetical protein
MRASCRSWVVLDEDISTNGVRLVFDDAAFAFQEGRVREALAGAE